MVDLDHAVALLAGGGVLTGREVALVDALTGWLTGAGCGSGLCVVVEIGFTIGTVVTVGELGDSVSTEAELFIETGSATSSNETVGELSGRVVGTAGSDGWADSAGGWAITLRNSGITPVSTRSKSATRN